MRPRPRRSSNAARPSSASGGCAIALSPTASRKPATACSPSHGFRQVSGEAREQRTRSSVCTKSSSGGSRRRPCCRRQKRQRCCSGRCSPLVRSTCARLMVGRRWPQSPSINRLTSPPDRILSKCRRSRHQIPTPLATAPRPDTVSHLASVRHTTVSMSNPTDRVEIITSVQRRRRWTAAEKVRMVDETFEAGMTVSLVARRHGVAPNQLFTWRRLVVEGALTAAGSGEQVVPASDYRALQSQVRELQRLLGKKTLEAEILKEAL